MLTGLFGPGEDDDEDASGGSDGGNPGDSDDSASDDEEDSSESNGKSGKSEQFFDPNKVPAPLKGAWRKMQAAFTQGMQGRAAERRKAVLFDRLVRNPQIKAILDGKEDGDEDRAEAKGKKSSSAKDLESTLEKVLDKRLKPLEQKFEKEDIEKQFKAFKRKHKDFNIYKSEMANLMDRHPKASFEELYAMAKHNVSKHEQDDEDEDVEDRDEDDVREDEDDDEDERADRAMNRLKKKTRVHKSGSGKGGIDKGEKKITTVREAYEKAKRDLLKKG